ncbi:MAG: hypothetical protein ACLFR0_01820 [Alphaproteobacteria bacterium]
MSGKIIHLADHFAARRKNKPPAPLADMRDQVTGVKSASAAFEPEEIKFLLDLHRKAAATGFIRDYAMPMTSDARPLFSFKSCAHEPDYMNMEKAALEDGKIIYIVRKIGETPVIEDCFEEAYLRIDDEIERLEKRPHLHIASSSFDGFSPE